MGSAGNYPVFDTAAVNTALVGTRFGRKLQHFRCVDSTNAMLLEAAAQGAPEGTAFVADEQTAGRGRGGHTWHSSPGDGLYVSALTKPSLPLSQALRISLATGLAAQAAIQETSGLAVDLRWPNDLLCAGRKCGGILVETAMDSDGVPGLRYAVIGIGINVNHAEFPAEISALATSLRIESGREQSRITLLIALLRTLDRELSLLEENGSAPGQNLLQRFAAASTWVVGKRVSVPEQGGYTGMTVGLDSSGFLQVQSDDGVLRTVLSGGVREL
ncbi:MAG TPA: biotin--[acetyl-CoA-carboxylase] ligase [Acidobacteriaceae bacterium]|jgi:BirA family biotin operon repressor/biotin-[acetyl-CoA-carboxylase] ligase